MVSIGTGMGSTGRVCPGPRRDPGTRHPSDFPVWRAEGHAQRGGCGGRVGTRRQSRGTHAPAVYAPKAALGHSVGAVGAVESILTVLALRDGVIPPTLNLRKLDPEIELDVVTGEPRTGDYQYAVNNSFAFGGYNVALAFGKY